MLVRALHDLTTVASDELAFHVGDILTVLDDHVAQDTNVWVRAEKDGMVGLIPMNYFEVLPDSTPRQSGRDNGTPDGGAEESDSPPSSLLLDVVVTSQNSNRSGSKIAHQGGKASSSPEIQMHYYDGMETPWNESTSSLGLHPGAEDHDSPVASGLLVPSNPWAAKPEAVRNVNERKAHTAPPSPSRHPVPTPSPRQLTSTLTHSATPKKPPPPPPPARRSQSSTQVGTLVTSAAAPPTLSPPSRRPPLPARAATTHQDHSHEVSPFDS
jgi:SH3 domain